MFAILARILLLVVLLQSARSSDVYANISLPVTLGMPGHFDDAHPTAYAAFVGFVERERHCGLLAAFEAQNDAGGVAGRALAVARAENGGGLGDEAMVQATRRLYGTPGLHGVTAGHTFSSMVAAKVSLATSMPLFGAMHYAKSYYESDSGVFANVRAGTELPAALHFAVNGVPRARQLALVFTELPEIGERAALMAAHAAERLGIPRPLVMGIPTLRTTTAAEVTARYHQHVATLLAMPAHQRPTAFVLMSEDVVSDLITSIWLHAAQMGFAGMYFVAPSTALGEGFSINGTAAPFRNLFVTSEVPFGTDTSFEVVQRFHGALAALKAKVALAPGVNPVQCGYDAPSTAALEGYVTGRLFVEALQRTPGGPAFRPQAILDSVYRTRTFAIDDLVLGPYGRGCTGRQTAATGPCTCPNGARAVYVGRIDGSTGRVVPIEHGFADRQHHGGGGHGGAGMAQHGEYHEDDHEDHDEDHEREDHAHEESDDAGVDAHDAESTDAFKPEGNHGHAGGHEETTGQHSALALLDATEMPFDHRSCGAPITFARRGVVVLLLRDAKSAPAAVDMQRAMAAALRAMMLARADDISGAGDAGWLRPILVSVTAAPGASGLWTAVEKLTQHRYLTVVLLGSSPAVDAAIHRNSLTAPTGVLGNSIDTALEPGETEQWRPGFLPQLQLAPLSAAFPDRDPPVEPAGGAFNPRRIPMYPTLADLADAAVRAAADIRAAQASDPAWRPDSPPRIAVVADSEELAGYARRSVETAHVTAPVRVAGGSAVLQQPGAALEAAVRAAQGPGEAADPAASGSTAGFVVVVSRTRAVVGAAMKAAAAVAVAANASGVPAQGVWVVLAADEFVAADELTAAAAAPAANLLLASGLPTYAAPAEMQVPAIDASTLPGKAAAKAYASVVAQAAVSFYTQHAASGDLPNAMATSLLRVGMLSAGPSVPALSPLSDASCGLSAAAWPRPASVSPTCQCAKGINTFFVRLAGSALPGHPSFEAGGVRAMHRHSACGVQYTALPQAVLPRLGTQSIALIAGACSLALCACVVMGGVWFGVLRRPGRSSANAPKDAGEPFAMVFTDIQSSTALWAICPEHMGEALDTHNALVRRLIGKFGGYEVKTIGDSFMVAFRAPGPAVEFSIAAQRAMYEADWGAGGAAIEAAYGELLENVTILPTAADVDRGDIAPLQLMPGDADYDALWRGLRVRVGVTFGHGEIRQDAQTGLFDYFGTVVNTAARIETVAHGGQVIVAADALGALDGAAAGLGGGVVALPLGPQHLRGLPEPVEMVQLLPAGQLAGRRFPALRLEVDAQAADDWHEAGGPRGEGSTATTIDESVLNELLAEVEGMTAGSTTAPPESRASNSRCRSPRRAPGTVSPSRPSLVSAAPAADAPRPVSLRVTGLLGPQQLSGTSSVADGPRSVGGPGLVNVSQGDSGVVSESVDAATGVVSAPRDRLVAGGLPDVGQTSSGADGQPNASWTRDHEMLVDSVSVAASLAPRSVTSIRLRRTSAASSSVAATSKPVARSAAVLVAAMRFRNPRKGLVSVLQLHRGVAALLAACRPAARKSCSEAIAAGWRIPPALINAVGTAEGRAALYSADRANERALSAVDRALLASIVKVAKAAESRQAVGKQVPGFVSAGALGAESGLHVTDAVDAAASKATSLSVISHRADGATTSPVPGVIPSPNLRNSASPPLQASKARASFLTVA